LQRNSRPTLRVSTSTSEGYRVDSVSP
jgi:hypothetical protein